MEVWAWVPTVQETLGERGLCTHLVADRDLFFNLGKTHISNQIPVSQMQASGYVYEIVQKYKG